MTDKMKVRQCLLDIQQMLSKHQRQNML